MYWSIDVWCDRKKKGYIFFKQSSVCLLFLQKKCVQQESVSFFPVEMLSCTQSITAINWLDFQWSWPTQVCACVQNTSLHIDLWLKGSWPVWIIEASARVVVAQSLCSHFPSFVLVLCSFLHLDFARMIEKESKFPSNDPHLSFAVSSHSFFSVGSSLCQHKEYTKYVIYGCFFFLSTETIIWTHYKRASHTLASITLDQVALGELLSVRINFDWMEGWGSRGKCNGEICSCVIDFHVYSSDTTVEHWQTDPQTVLGGKHDSSGTALKV